ncbi:MAG TPA: penicillin-binding protein 2 [Hyphomicrobiaceae bacterium]|nr:penicillin-binding protein 2 [Hyphomicrobiaceae bacterium]
MGSDPQGLTPSRRALLALVVLLACFAAIAVQLLRLGLKGGLTRLRMTVAEVPTSGWARPDIVDRHGRLLASDRRVQSLFADPAILLDLDEAVEKVTSVLPNLDSAELRKALADRSRRFVWVARGLSPEDARRIHELGLPGLGFRTELRRTYPLGSLAGHVLGAVNVDNRGLAGIERMLDESGAVDPARGGERSLRPPVPLALDIGVQHGVREELKRALQQYGAKAAAALVMDVRTGEIVAAVSLPELDPNRPTELLDATLADRLLAGSFELGSVYKIITIALALECGIADLDTVLDVREPLTVGPHVIRDHYPQGRPLTVREVFLYSSNVGAGMLALRAGAERQRAFLAKLGLLEGMRTETGAVAPPQLPASWGRAETITIAYGHGLAVAPLQFAAAAAAIVNGGERVMPTFLLPTKASRKPARTRVVSAATSASLRELMRLGVTHKAGTGRRAEVEGYGVGGKTGTAEMPGRGGYREKSVIASFMAAFPMEAPRYVTLTMLFEPQGTKETRGRITAGVNAAPVTGRIVERIAPMLGVLPRLVETHKSAPFDAPHEAQ